MKNDIVKILEWYKENSRTLPWRREDISAYEVWVSEVMLQQTQVSRVVLYYERFLKKFPTIRELSWSSWEEFLPYYEGLGYYARGRNMLETAKIIVREFGGKFPQERNSLLKLPGVGEYTASAILSFAYHKPEVAFDTNFRKVFGTRKKAETAFKKSHVFSNVFNSAVMDYASVMKSEKPKVRKVQKTAISQVVVVLHENHKKYFSENKKKYEPFDLPKEVVSREHIKKYFLTKYGLRVSVRPLKGSVTNVQILSGRPSFAIYSKKDYVEWNDGDA
jgi:A/G-specific adenine glycosylase